MPTAGIRIADMLTTPVTSILMPNISYTPSADVLETEACIANGFDGFNFLKLRNIETLPFNKIDDENNKPGLTESEKEEITKALWKIESSFLGTSSVEDREIFMAAINNAIETTKQFSHKMTDADKEEVFDKIMGIKTICSHRLKLKIAQTEAQIISIRNEMESHSARVVNTCSRSLKICQMVSIFNMSVFKLSKYLNLQKYYNFQISSIFGFFFLKLTTDPSDYESTTFYNVTTMLGFAISACFLMISIPSNINEFDNTVSSFVSIIIHCKKFFRK